MTLQRRLIFSILVAAPFAWLLTIGFTYWRAQYEVSEMYDTDMVRMAQQVYALLPMLHGETLGKPAPVPRSLRGDPGQADLGNIVMSAWAPDGERLRADPDGDRLPKNEGLLGFSDTTIDGQPWRVYYLEGEGEGSWRVGIGQLVDEREELVFSSVISQIFPWLIGLPILLTLLILAVRRALQPVRTLSADIEGRSPNDPAPLNPDAVPGELKPLVLAMNRLLARVSLAIEHERRLTADAAHELRTPLAALRSQWEVAQRATDAEERAQAQANVNVGIERLNRLVSQLLAMARLENATQAAFGDDVSWPRVAQQAVSDCMAIAQRKDVDIELLWPPEGSAPLPLSGDEHLLALLLRNLLDNAIRYSERGGVVTVHFGSGAITVRDHGPGVSPSLLERLGDRFFRAPGQQEQGSGLGLSISRRVAQIHGLTVEFDNVSEAGVVEGFVATIRRVLF